MPHTDPAFHRWAESVPTVFRDICWTGIFLLSQSRCQVNSLPLKATTLFHPEFGLVPRDRLIGPEHHRRRCLEVPIAKHRHTGVQSKSREIETVFQSRVLQEAGSKQ